MINVYCSFRLGLVQNSLTYAFYGSDGSVRRKRLVFWNTYNKTDSWLKESIQALTPELRDKEIGIIWDTSHDYITI